MITTQASHSSFFILHFKMSDFAALNALMLANPLDDAFYMEPINSVRVEIINDWIAARDVRLIMERTTFRYVVAFLDQGTPATGKELPPAAIFDWFVSAEYADTLRARSVSPKQFAMELKKQHGILLTTVKTLTSVAQ
jgi:hypothetical protein